MADISAASLLAALARRHSVDVFVPECKNGPTQTGSHRRLDAWVMLKTWSPVTMIGYEIKVSRADWRRDEKIADYMGLCNLLSIVAPKGVVPVEELPDGVGLLELAGKGDGARLITKRRAARREIAVPSSLLFYVLMCRTTIDAKGEDPEQRQKWRADSLRDWASGKEDRMKLHYAISQKIQDRFRESESARQAAEQRAADMQRIDDRIKELGFDPSQPIRAWEIEAKLRAFDAAIPDHVLRSLERTERDLSSIRSSLEQMKRPVAVVA